MIGKISSKEGAKKKRKPLKKLVIVLILLEVAAFLTAIGFFIAAMSIDDFDRSFDLSSIGGSIFFGVVGTTMAFMILGPLISFLRHKRNMSIGYSSDKIAEEFGYENKHYTTKNYPSDVKPSKKQVYYCSYCGYGTDSLVGDCPKCGGPIKEK